MTKEEKVQSTKEKILMVANVLFANKGIDGTSVREIAKEADVNIAAINYHFKNKEGLYWMVFEHSHLLIENKISELGEKAKSTEELAIMSYNFFLTKESAILNTFKMFLSGSSKVDPELMPFGDKEVMGPPGEGTFMEKIKGDLGDEVSEMGQRWAVKMIFSLLIHLSVVSSMEIVKIKAEKDKFLAPEATEQSIRHSIRAALAYVKANPNLKVF